MALAGSPTRIGALTVGVDEGRCEKDPIIRAGYNVYPADLVGADRDMSSE